MKRRNLTTAFLALMAMVFAVPVFAFQSAHSRPQRERSYAKTQIKRMDRLERLMEEKLELSREQEEVFAEMFEDHVDALKDVGRDSDEDRAETAERIEELQEEIKEAQEDQDADRLSELSKERNELRRGGRGEIDGLNSEFYEMVREELDEDQVKGFNKLVREVSRKAIGADRQAARMKYKKTSDMMSMINQNCSPTADQKRQIQRRMVEFMQQTMDAMGAGEEDMGALQEDLRQDLLGMLDESQKRDFLAAEAEQIARETAEHARNKREGGADD